MESCSDTVKNFVKRFTLVELIVVIAVIGILISIIMPSLRKAREKTRSAVCMNNLKQFEFAYSIYTSEWGGFAPG